MGDGRMTRFTLADAVTVLERTPHTLTALLNGIPAIWATATEGDGTWSPFDVLGHLVHGERTDWLPRVRHILAGNAKPFPPFDRTAQFVDATDETMHLRLAMFAALRRESLQALQGLALTDADLDRPGLHPALGPVTLRQLLATWVVHDLDHITQIARTMAKVYRHDVGPWSEYLTVLRDRELMR